ncbi:MAG: hypothetical protein JW828_11555, partial [Sedimentisphaerales bacterium]|nr:hypothetical protein [Sedimentisphaerales bacterium]
MKRLVFLALFILVFHIGISLGTEYGGGSGTEEDPYQIGTAEELIALGQTIEDYDKCFVLTADINLSGNTFNRAVIAPDMDDTNYSGYNSTPFTGVFDGGGHQILNLKIEGDWYLGLFGQLSSSAVISNLGLENVDIHGIG